IPGRRLNLELIGTKTKISTQRRNVRGRNFRMIWKVQRSARLAKLLRIAPRGSNLGIGAVDPVVDPIQESVDAQLRVERIESGEENLSLVGAMVAVGVGQVENIGRRRDQDSILP